MLFDLHSHTNASDGLLSSEELVERAAQKGVDVLAITDHDSVAGLHLAQVAIAQKNLPLRLINGIEISCIWENIEIHIVGLNIDPNAFALQNLIEQQAIRRYERAKNIAHRLAKLQIVDAFEGVQALAVNSSITRAHFARWMVNQGLVKNQQNAFKQYLSKGKRAYVPPNWCSMQEAIDIIHQAKGKAVLAHPNHYELTTKWLKRLLQVFAQANGDAMEVACSQQSIQARCLLANYANQYQLLSSQGSDFHYPSPWIELGRNLYLVKGCTGVWSSWERAME